MYKVLYKYIDVHGAKCIIGNQQLQFTNATQLNDPFDCHPQLMDFSQVPESKIRRGTPTEWLKDIAENDALNLRNDTWLCSLSKVNDSMLMWTHYCKNHTGICIGFNLEKVMEHFPQAFGSIYIKPFIFDVEYQDIINRPNAYNDSKDLFRYQLCTKAKGWAYEQEVRLVMPDPSWMYAAFTPQQAKLHKKIWDSREIHHYVPLKEECFESIYFGINIGQEEKEAIIKKSKEINPQIKLYQMTIDENAFKFHSQRL